MGLQWLRVGRDPRAGPIVTLYDPPPGLTPAAARYIQRMGYDDRCLAADAVELAASGIWRIASEGREYSVERLRPAAGGGESSTTVLDRSLLGGTDRIALVQKNHQLIGAARQAHETWLRQHFGKANFANHAGIGCLGGLLVLVGAAAAFLFDPLGATRHEVLPGMGGFLAASIAASCAYDFFRARRHGYRRLGSLAWTLVFAVAALAAGWYLAGRGNLLLAVLLAALGIAWAVLSFMLQARTPAGQRLFERILGLRDYLGVAERDDLARAKAPPMTAEEYQRLLPWAIALEVEKTWGERLAAAIGPAAAAAAVAGMSWYDGGGGGNFEPARFGSSLGSSFSGAISSSATAPGSSSGSSGGGSSGGGGGGGGGGGW